MAVITGTFGNDVLIGTPEDDIINGFGGEYTINGGAGNDSFLYVFPISGFDKVDLGSGSDVVNIFQNNFPFQFVQYQSRLTLESDGIGNGSPLAGNTITNPNGDLAVSLQRGASSDFTSYDYNFSESAAQFDDEGITFQSDIMLYVQERGSNQYYGAGFNAVLLGTSDDDLLSGGQSARPHYINGGMGNDTIYGGLGGDFIVGGVGNDSLFGSDGDDFIDGGIGNDNLSGGLGDDMIIGGVGNDVATFNVTTDGADKVDLGDGSDLVNVAAATAGQVRLSLTSAEVGNGNVNDVGTLANQDGGLAVRLQAEGDGDALTGAVSRFDDEGITFAAALGTTFDVRDLVSGVQRGDAFEFITLGTSGSDTLTATQDARPYYINGGMGNDVITGGSANDFLVGGAGNDALSGGAGNDTFIGGGGNDLLEGGSGIDRAIFAYTLGSATLGRSADGYVTITGAEGTDTLRGIEQFQFSDRTVNVADGAPLVDDLFYLNRYGDVAAAGQDADAHYAAYGAAEGRDPNAFFSTSGYRAANQDVVQTGTDALSQYRDAAFKQGRDPGASFDNEFYLARNPDVAVAGLNPLQHYLEYGQSEGRSINEAIGRAADLKGGAFDAEFYLLSYSDVAAEAAKTSDSFAYARNHFEQYGWREGRDPNAVFETKGYLNAYADVAGANINPLTHYDQYGWKENRDPSVDFDSSNYLKAYGDVTLTGLNPMQHYLQYGLYEGRSTFADGTFGSGLIG